MPKYPSRNKKSHKKLIVLIIIIVLLVAGFFLWRHHHNKPKQVMTNAGTATANTNVPGGSSNSNSNNSGNNSSVPPSSSGNSKDEGSNTLATTLPPSVQPTAPTGEFVSDHSVSASDTESSTCSTTPGAYCQITFTEGSLTKKLKAQLTNQNGNTIWDSWTPASIGLTSGSWTVTAVAINGSKTASAQDATKLVIQ